jgi:hypothetical protein
VGEMPRWLRILRTTSFVFDEGDDPHGRAAALAGEGGGAEHAAEEGGLSRERAGGARERVGEDKRRRAERKRGRGPVAEEAVAGYPVTVTRRRRRGSRDLALGTACERAAKTGAR